MIQGLWRRVAVGSEGVLDGDTLVVRDLAPGTLDASLARLKIGPDGAYRVRLQAVDAPESHYAGGSPRIARQPTAPAQAASEALHRLLAGAQPAPLWLYADGVDRYGRLLAVVWTDPGLAGEVRLPSCPALEHPASDAAHEPSREPAVALALADSINARLLAQGVAYPDFHAGLPRAAWTCLAAAVAEARARQLGIWTCDRTPQGFRLDQAERLCDEVLILPRLFRRVSDFVAARPELTQHGSFFAGVPPADGTPCRVTPPAATGQPPCGITLAGPPALDRQLGQEFTEFLDWREGSMESMISGSLQKFSSTLQIDGLQIRCDLQVENFLRYRSPSAGNLT